MPKIAPIRAAGTMMDDLGGALEKTIQDTTREATNVLKAEQAARILESLTGRSSNNSSQMKDAAEAFGSLTAGLKGMGDLQTLLMNQIKESMGGNGKTGNSVTDLIGLILAMKLIEPSKKEKDELSPIMAYLLESKDKEIQELKESRGPSRVDEQMNSLTTQLLAQHISTMANPWAGLEQLALVKEKLGGLLGERSSVPPEYTEGALKLRALEKEEKAMELEHHKALEANASRERIWSQYAPDIAARAGQIIGNVLASFAPPPPGQGFDPDAAAEAEKMAAGQE